MESELETRTSGVLVSLADSPNAGSRTQSAAGADILFEAKKKKKQSTSSLAGQDDGYEVTFTVTIAMAVPTVYEDQDGQTPSPVAGDPLANCLAESARSSNIQQHKSRRAQLIGSRHITCTICFSQHLLT
ncbi:hypothetical protein BgiBS90_017011 [Biomphalaria glabrata]|nr:hypothetical protein BgiMline_028971 [Biomphalaria glabrata]KAI8781615.1 hypothetical protein BgiBS90_017011 [Biomphalaria glabrata]